MAEFLRGNKFSARGTHLWRGLFGAMFCLASLSACTPPPEPMATPLPVVIPSETPRPTPTFFPIPQPSLTPTPSPVVFVPASPSATPTQIPHTLCSPLEGYTFAELPDIESQPFIAPRPGKDDGHHGVDFAHWQYKDRMTLEGVGVQSVLSGVVAASVPEKYPYGNMIIVETPVEFLSPEALAAFQIQPGQSLYLLYAHLKTPSPYQLGDPVTCGDLLGNVGNTGASGNPHLHLETRVGPAGATFASMEYYKTTSTDEERANYESWRFLGDFILFNPWTLLNLSSD
ncbi:MAG: peptidoglycan DD-metalloendopeptidase family protein [Anaerolineales bacterium]|nr:peptidoglycan DD-metalloendopeptidase family protein [Anaerolineales bacterium]